MHIVYILEETRDNQRYIGYTADLSKRISEHNRHKNISTTHGNWKLIYAEAYLHKKDALGRELFLKSGAGWRFIKKQISHYLSSDSN